MDKQKLRKLAAALLHGIASDLENRGDKDDEIAAFLDQMSNLFRSHGCNDFAIDDIFPQQSDRIELLQDYIRFDPQSAKEWQEEGIDLDDFRQFLDYALMAYVAKRLAHNPDKIAPLWDRSRYTDLSLSFRARPSESP